MTPAGRGRGLGQPGSSRAPVQLGSINGVVVRLSAEVA